MIELLNRDAAGRISKLTIGKRSLILPEIAIVIDPRKMVIEPKQLQKEFGANLLITNAYLIKKYNVKIKNLHKDFKFDGIIMNDSGAYQAMYGGSVNTTNKEIIKFQEKIRPDIGTFLDVPSRDLPYKEANKTVLETIKRAKEAKRLTKNSKLLWAAPIQGGEHLDLVKKCAKALSKLDFDIYPVGSIVPKMVRYDFKTVCDQIITAKQNVPADKPLHAFGLGLPSFMSLAVACGADIFDSAAYALYAYDDRYMTLEGTKHLNELAELPCTCPVCTNYTAKELKDAKRKDRQKLLARHNLYVTFGELRTIRQAIRENNLFELVQQRCRAHPKLLEAFIHVITKHKKYFSDNDPITKKSALFWSQESEFRPEVVRAKEKIKQMKYKKYFNKQPFGKVPVGLKNIYPFSQSITPDNPKVRAPADLIFSQTVEYLYGKTKIKPKVEVSRKTGRTRRAFYKGRLIGTFRPSDGMFLPTMDGAKHLKLKKVFVNKDAAEYAVKGKSVFAKFVKKTDNIIPGEEVAVYYNKKLLAVGRALMNSKEMKDFNRGAAIKIRKHI